MIFFSFTSTKVEMSENLGKEINFGSGFTTKVGPKLRGRRFTKEHSVGLGPKG